MFLSNQNQIRVKKIQILPADIIQLDTVPLQILDTTNIPHFIPLQITLVSPNTTRIDNVDSLIIETGGGRIIALLNPTISQLSYGTNYFFNLEYDGTIYGGQMNNAYDYFIIRATTGSVISANGADGVYIFINYMQYIL